MAERFQGFRQAVNEIGTNRAFRRRVFLGLVMVSGAVALALCNRNNSQPKTTILDTGENGVEPRFSDFTAVPPTDYPQYPTQQPIKLPGYAVADDGTMFPIVPDWESRRTCAVVAGKFEDSDGHRNDAGRLMQALGNYTDHVTGLTSIYDPDKDLLGTFDSNKDPFPEGVHFIKVGTIGCIYAAVATP